MPASPPLPAMIHVHRSGVSVMLPGAALSARQMRVWLAREACAQAARDVTPGASVSLREPLRPMAGEGR